MTTLENASMLIAEFDQRLALKFRNEPFARVNIARAFAKGLQGNRSDEDDPHPAALAVLNVALADQDDRRRQMLAHHPLNQS